MIITESDGTKDVLFGDGSVLVAAGKGLLGDHWYDALFLASKDPEPVGTLRPDCAGKELFGAEVRLLFTRVESIDVVIKGLLEVRAIIENVDNGEI